MTANTAHITGSASNWQADTAPDQLDIDISGLINIFWRHKGTIIIVTLIGIALSIFAALSLQPKYKAHALISLEQQSSTNIPSAFELLSFRGNKFNSSYVLSEIEVIRSRDMIRQVIDRLNISQGTSATRFSQKAVNVPFSRFKSFAVQGKDTNIQSLSPEEAAQERTITRFLESLSLKIIPGSSIVRIEYIADSPEKAALYANTVTDVYADYRSLSQKNASEKVKSWLEIQISKLDGEIKDAQRNVVHKREQSGMSEGRWGALNEEKISTLNAQILKLRNENADLEASIELITAANGDYGQMHKIPAINNAPSIQRLNAEKIKLKQKLSDYATRYGNKHPTIIKTKSEINALTRTIHEEIDTIIAHLQTNYAQKTKLIDNIKTEIDSISKETLENLEEIMAINEIERHIESKTQMYLKTIQAMQQINLEELGNEELNVISYAVPPLYAIAPNKRLIVILGTFLAFSIGIIIAIIREKTNLSIHSTGHIEQITGLPCFGLIPAVSPQKGERLSSYLVKNPTSMVAESIRTLRMAINLQGPKKPKIINVTSSLSGEGKTTISTWISTSAAKSGKRVILVDCDLRRPNIHRFMGHKNELSIVEYLSGKAELKDVIKKDPSTGLDIIYARSVPSSAMDLITSDKMQTLLEKLEDYYDLIILDTPACLAVSDARALATYSDLTLYTVKWGETTAPTLSIGTKQFKDLNVKMATILTNVDVVRQARYGYASTVEYYEDSDKS